MDNDYRIKYTIIVKTLLSELPLEVLLSGK